MKTAMKKTAIVLAMLPIFGFSAAAMAGWADKCQGCHSDAGKPAPGKAALTAKFKSADAFVKGAKASTNPMMKSVQEADVKAAAADLGLK